MERRRQEEAMRALQRGGGTNVNTAIYDEQGQEEANWDSPAPDRQNPHWMTDILTKLSPATPAINAVGSYFGADPKMVERGLDSIMPTAEQLTMYGGGAFIPGAPQIGAAAGGIKDYLQSMGQSGSQPQGYGYQDHSSSSAPVGYRPQDHSSMPDYGYRQDGSAKGQGFLGPMTANDGRTMTELSVGVNMDGQEVQIPLMVPGLTQQELQFLQSGPSPDQIPRSILDKAVAHAQQRMSQGSSPFAGGMMQQNQPAARQYRERTQVPQPAQKAFPGREPQEIPQGPPSFASDLNMYSEEELPQDRIPRRRQY